MPMDPRLEAKEIANVHARLAERFSTLDKDTIDAAVRLAHAEMTGRIRDYVPVLVERNARRRLADFAGHRERTQPGMRTHAGADVGGQRLMVSVRAEVEVDGNVDDIDFRPYEIGSEHNGATSILTFDVKDSHEFVHLLLMLISHDLHIKRAQLPG